MVNYQNGKIYMIESLIGDCRYIGSTCQKLSQRMTDHKKRYRYGKLNCKSKEVLKYDDAKIYMILTYPCDSKEELFAMEGKYIRETECVNKQIAGRTKKQYREDNKEYTKEYNKKYREKNKEILLKKEKEKYTCVCGSTIRKSDKARHFKTKRHLKFIEQQ